MTGRTFVAILCVVALLTGGVPPRAWAQNGEPSKKQKTSPAKKGVKDQGAKAPMKRSTAPVEGGALDADPSPETGNEPADPGEQEAGEVETSTGTAARVDQLQAAIGDMNYKLEIMQERYLKLNQDIEDLRLADRDQRRLFNEQVLLQVDPKKIDSMEAEIALVRSDLAQAREEIALISRETSERASRRGEAKKDFDDIIRSPWIGVSALGLSILAILVR